MTPRPLVLALAAVRFGSRALGRDPIASLLAVLVVATALLLSVVCFAVLYGVFYRPLPLPAPEQLVALAAHFEDETLRPLTPSEFERLAEQLGSESGGRSGLLAGWMGTNTPLEVEGEPARRVNGAVVTGEFFNLLGVPPARGRWIDESDTRPGAEQVAVISHRLWQEAFAGSRRVFERELDIRGSAHLIVGIAPPGYHFPLSQEFWVPYQVPATADAMVRPSLQGLMRRPPPTVTSLNQQLQSLSAEVPVAVLGTRARPVEFRARPFRDAYSDSELEKSLLRVTLIVASLLLLAGANVGSFLLSRFHRMRGEMAVRLVCGAKKWHLGLLVFGEALVHALLGGLLGAIAAVFAVRHVEPIVRQQIRTSWVQLEIDGAFIAMAALQVIAIVLLASLAVWVRVTTADLQKLLSESAGATVVAGPTRDNAALLGLQIAIAVMAIAVAFQVASGRQEFEARAPDAPGDLVVSWLSVPRESYDATELLQLFRRIGLELDQRSEVEAHGWVSGLPLQTSRGQPLARLGDEVRFRGRVALSDRGFFEVVGLDALEGRLPGSLSDPSAASESVVVIGRELARELDLSVGSPLALGEGENAVTVRVAAVTADRFPAALPARRRGFLPLFADTESLAADAVLFAPLALAPSHSVQLVTRARDPAAAVREIREVVAAVEPKIVMTEPQTLQQMVDSILWDYLLVDRLAMVFGWTALAIVGLGLLSLVAELAAAKRPELALRAALGSTPSRSAAWLLGRVFAPVGLGLLAGGVLAFAASRSLEAVLHGLEADSLEISGTALAVTATVAVAAAVLPVARTARWSADVVLKPFQS